ncbi:hypothetical protein K435DRAFT_860637 [Dendrothele bispora CBS 962.96]|uniref:Uncharacterized protein n=1 Tax=Dendrothele bispora (strain CBS 962.96) TaxID=1314807 RepID=A0A4S8LXG4_DENBC|nr:hypothetical protein K435DRAFT_860637 [Dendrothele bispora CBS 962.96]
MAPKSKTQPFSIAGRKPPRKHARLDENSRPKTNTLPLKPPQPTNYRTVDDLQAALDMYNTWTLWRKDPYPVVHKFLEKCWSGLLSDPQVKRTMNISLFNEVTIGHLMKLYDSTYAEDEDPEHVPADISPELVARAGLTLVPRLSSRWISSNILLFGTISLPVPKDSFLLPTHSDGLMRSSSTNVMNQPIPPPLPAVIENIPPSKCPSSTSVSGSSSRSMSVIQKSFKYQRVRQLFQEIANSLQETLSRMSLDSLKKRGRRSYEALKAIGAITRLLQGLGVDPSKGLNDEQGNLNTPLTRVKSAEAKGGITAPGDKSLRQNPSHNPGGQHLPALTLTEPDGGVAGVSPSPSSSPSTQSIHSGTVTGKGDDFDISSALNGSIADRRHIYGTSMARILPARGSKTLLQLMFAAMKDKVLILLAITAVILLSLSRFGTLQDPDDLPLDWVEGVAIIVAISIVVIVGLVNNWQKECQFQPLNDKKEERGVLVVIVGSVNDWQKERQLQALNDKEEHGAHVVRGGVELVIDVKQVVVGDIAVLEPGEIVPYDSIFLSGRNVRCDESGATGESDLERVTPLGR